MGADQEQLFNNRKGKLICLTSRLIIAFTYTLNPTKPTNLQTLHFSQYYADAIEIIIRYSLDYSTILNRKCIKRDILFQYCHNTHIFIVPPVTKLSLIQKILDHWADTSNTQQQISQIIEENTAVAENHPETSNEDINLMAFKFTEWFYSLMNSDECIGEEHFWEDCSLQINLISAENRAENCIENNRTEVTRALFKTKHEHGLFFNPNLSHHGVYGKMDAHGLVLIFVCGTLNTNVSCVGVFEQIFSLARDPFCENNWKIKNTRLNLSSKHVSETPRLCDSSLSNELALNLQ